MHITFLGTRGNIKIKSQRHKRHTITVISNADTRVAIDCGLDWLGNMDEINPDAIVITHAHDDHIDGLKYGAPCPIYATKATWEHMHHFPLKKRITIKERKKFYIGSLCFEAFFVQHSLRAPAVGYRITDGSTIIFCVHDLISIKNQQAALDNVQLYIGDGASVTRPIIRYKDNAPFGHTTIARQLEWCHEAQIPQAIFTHCGSQIVKSNVAVIENKIKEYGLKQGVTARIAYDGMKISI